LGCNFKRGDHGNKTNVLKGGKGRGASTVETQKEILGGGC